jgi:hypothetical protein
LNPGLIGCWFFHKANTTPTAVFLPEWRTHAAASVKAAPSPVKSLF